MKSKIRENKFCGWRDILKGLMPIEFPILEGIAGEIIFTGTGRSALRIILDFMKISGFIKDKNTQVLVPHWLTYAVTYVMHKVCFPVLTCTDDVKGILVYHQYGFPQNMDEIIGVSLGKKWFVIEDCSDVYESYYKGRRLGTFGQASIFSFHKLFSTVMAGALVTQDKELIKFARSLLSKENDGWLSFWAQLIRVLSERNNSAFWNTIQEMIYARIDSLKSPPTLSLNLVKRDLLNNAIGKRKRNYQFLLDYFQGYDFFKGLEREEVVPLVAPLITNENKLKDIKRFLLAAGIWTDIYHFDINRNLLNPKFIKCLWVPVHQRLTLDNMNRICEIIKAAA